MIFQMFYFRCLGHWLPLWHHLDRFFFFTESFQKIKDGFSPHEVRGRFPCWGELVTPICPCDRMWECEYLSFCVSPCHRTNSQLFQSALHNSRDCLQQTLTLIQDLDCTRRRAEDEKLSLSEYVKVWIDQFIGKNKKKRSSVSPMIKSISTAMSLPMVLRPTGERWLPPLSLWLAKQMS